jgi:hypothetical protein
MKRFHKGQAVSLRGATGTSFGHVVGYEDGYVMVRWSGTSVVTGVRPSRLRGLPPGYAGRANPIDFSNLTRNQKILIGAGGLTVLGVGGYMLYNYLNYGTVMGGTIAPGGGGGGGGSFVSPSTTAPSGIPSWLGAMGSSFGSFVTSIENALGIGSGGPSTTAEANVAPGDVNSGDGSDFSDDPLAAEITTPSLREWELEHPGEPVTEAPPEDLGTVGGQVPTQAELQVPPADEEVGGETEISNYAETPEGTVLSVATGPTAGSVPTSESYEADVPSGDNSDGAAFGFLETGGDVVE